MQQKYLYFTAHISLFYSTKHHYFTAQASLSNSTDDTLLQHRHHYPTAQISLLFKTHTHTHIYIYILSTHISILQHKLHYCKHKLHYCIAQKNLFYSTINTIVQHSYHYFTANLSLLYSTNFTIVQRKHHYCTAQTSLLYSTKITLVQHKYHYCTVQTSLLYITNILIVQHKRHYFTAQGDQNICVELQISDIFCSVLRTWISCDFFEIYLSIWTLHSSVTCISKEVYESRTDELLTAWITPRVPSFGVDKYRYFHPMGFLISSYKQSRQNMTLFSQYHTGIIHTPGTLCSLIYLDRITLTSSASLLTTHPKYTLL